MSLNKEAYIAQAVCLNGRFFLILYAGLENSTLPMAEVKKDIGYFQKTLAMGKVEKHCGRFFYNPLTPVWKILLCPWQRLKKTLDISRKPLPWAR